MPFSNGEQTPEERARDLAYKGKVAKAKRDARIGKIILFVLIAITLVGFGFMGGHDFKKHYMRKQAIENNVAHYHPKTGDFTWGALDAAEK